MTARKRKVTPQDIDILFRLAELYNTEYDFQAAEVLGQLSRVHDGVVYKQVRARKQGVSVL
jgi:hypothetical protein